MVLLKVTRRPIVSASKPSLSVAMVAPFSRARSGLTLGPGAGGVKLSDRVGSPREPHPKAARGVLRPLAGLGRGLRARARRRGAGRPDAVRGRGRVAEACPRGPGRYG